MGLIFLPPYSKRLNFELGRRGLNPWGLAPLPAPPVQPVSKEFALVIPKIGVNAPVATVPNQGGGRYFPALGKGEKLGHLENTALPGQGGNVVIFGHSSGLPGITGPYKDVFALLDKLEEGDEVVVWYQAVPYRYRVKESKVVGENAFEILSQEKNQLTLLTCWPPGTDIKRLIVIAEPAK